MQLHTLRTSGESPGSGANARMGRQRGCRKGGSEHTLPHCCTGKGGASFPAFRETPPKTRVHSVLLLLQHPSLSWTFRFVLSLPIRNKERDSSPGSAATGQRVMGSD